MHAMSIVLTEFARPRLFPREPRRITIQDITPDEFVRLVLAVIRKHHLEKRVILQSFDWRTLHAMKKQAPDKEFIPAPPDANCACNECPFMKKNTLEKVYLALRDLSPRLEMKPELLSAAKKPIDRMLALS